MDHADADGDTVARVLREAAARASRHASLDYARTSVERTLNFDLPDLPWGSAMSTTYLLLNRESGM